MNGTLDETDGHTGRHRANNRIFRFTILAVAAIAFAGAAWIASRFLPSAMAGWGRQRIVGAEAFRKSIDLSRPGTFDVTVYPKYTGLSICPILEVDSPRIPPPEEMRWLMRGLEMSLEFHVGGKPEFKYQVEFGTNFFTRPVHPRVRAPFSMVLGAYEPGEYKLILRVDQPAKAMSGRKQEVVGRYDYFMRQPDADFVDIRAITWACLPGVVAGMLFLIAGLPAVFPSIRLSRRATWMLLIPAFLLLTPTLIATSLLIYRTRSP